MDFVNFAGFRRFRFDWCYDHEFVIASPIDYDTAAFLLAGVIIDVTLLHWAMITVTVIAITVAIGYHNVHVVMMMRMSF